MKATKEEFKRFEKLGKVNLPDILDIDYISSLIWTEKEKVADMFKNYKEYKAKYANTN